ncbi:D-ribose ABC transporter substrate-binding protein [Macrococcoides caseolyticum]|uniref:substrate-binding domain-containing protein n=1 Tax=Macrococcoides caseolyticum TaxID=69966 RepID=UPI000C3383EA|nr:substrate-binding domain-containing protein [Macrococcus caseolyticus]PKE50192.1 D-ribose ABC transporter substrate-binding protein [Macrococcus caseolyticus]PKF21859.1 D-ribose ABC transporter substrate-binding protein [Macrococcus caseolyticus]PKF35916.1 D-ribose ABC transporter substrate-binding protein [Macrococcus caseolyticus]
MKRILPLLLIALLTLSACSLEPPAYLKEDKTNKSNKDITIGVSLSTLNNPFFVSIKEAIQKEAKNNNFKIKVVDAQDDSAKQSNDIDDLIQQQVDYLIINPTDSAAISSAVQNANAQDIPVITLDRSVEQGKVTQFIASDNVAGGKMAGEYIVKQVGEKAIVGELEGVPGASATRERGKGFHIVADKQLTVASKQTAKFNRAEGLNVTQNMIQSHPDIKAIFAHNDEMALGAIEAIGTKDILVVGFDGNDDAMKSIKNKKLDATIAQQPALMGEDAVKAILDLKDGKKIKSEVKVPLKLVEQ